MKRKLKGRLWLIKLQKLPLTPPTIFCKSYPTKKSSNSVAVGSGHPSRPALILVNRFRLRL